MNSLYRIIRDNKYNYVLRFGQNSVTATDLVVAKFAGAKRLAYRSANSSIGGNWTKKVLHRLFFPLGVLVPNVKIAPSDLAAEFMFGKRAVRKGKVLMLNNGIPIEDYSFNSDAKRHIRESIGVKDELLIGHIGRFTQQKNHRFLIDVFNEIVKKTNAHLMLVGEGELEDEIKFYVRELGILDKVSFMGVRRDVPALLSAMDVFAFPSLYEGMPNTVIEAQANGLPCFISETITKSAQICGNVYMLPLEKAIWSDLILEKSARIPSEMSGRLLRDSGYDIKQVTNTFVDKVFGIKD